MNYMDFLFQEKYKYKIDEPLENVKAEINDFAGSNWFDLKENIRGEVSEDNTFTLRPKFTIPITILGIMPDYALLEGELSVEEERTIIRITARTSYLIVFLFYFLLFLLVLRVISLRKPLSVDSFFMPIALAFVLIFLYGVVSFSMKRMTRRFERLMGVRMRNR